MAFLYYYPRSTIQVPISEFVEDAQGTVDVPWICGLEIGFSDCDAEYMKESLTDLDELNREFGVPTNECIPTDPIASTDDQNDDLTDKSAGVSNFKLLVAGAAMAMVLGGFAL
jgi:hypothetical protein